MRASLRVVVTLLVVAAAVLAGIWLWRYYMPVSYTHLDVYKRQVMWFAPQALGNWGIQRSCLDGKRDDKDLSHDNLFHSVLGLLDVQTSLYQPALDIFASCRAPRAAQ